MGGGMALPERDQVQTAVIIGEPSPPARPQREEAGVISSAPSVHPRIERDSIPYSSGPTDEKGGRHTISYRAGDERIAEDSISYRVGEERGERVERRPR